MLHLCNTAMLKNLREGFVAISNLKKASVMNSFKAQISLVSTKNKN